MKCYKHPDRKGTASCVICGKLLCNECQIKIGEQIVCKSCVAGLLTETTNQNSFDENDLSETETRLESENEDKPKKSLFGFLKRDNKETKKSEPRTQETINQYPYGEINNPYTEEIIHEETYDFWEPEPENTQDQKQLFESDSYATQSEKPKSPLNIFKRHKMEKPEKKIQSFDESSLPNEIVIDHSDDEPSQLDTLFMEEEDEFDYDYTYSKKNVTEENKTEEKEEPAKTIVIDHTDDETSQIKDYNPQHEEPELKEEMENIIDRTSELSKESKSPTEPTQKPNNNTPKDKTNKNTNPEEKPIKKLSKEEIEDLIYQLHKEGNSPSKIGIILRDQYNVPNIKAATGQKLTKIIKHKEELENATQSDLKNDDTSDKMSIASATESSVIDTENNSKNSEEKEEPKLRPSLKPFDDINGPQVFDYEHGAPVDKTATNKEEPIETPVEKTTIPKEEPEETTTPEVEEEETETEEIIIEKTSEDLEILKKIEEEPEKPPVEEPEKPPVEEPEKPPKQKSTTVTSSKTEPIPTITPTERKQISPRNSVSMQSIIDSSMFVKSYVDNYSLLPSSVRIDHEKWNMSEFLYFAVTSVINISEGIYEPILKLSLIDVMNNTEDFKFGTITKEDYIFLAKLIRSYIDTEGRAPFNRQSTIGVIQFRSLVYIFASILTIYKFTNQLPETYLVNDNVFKLEDDDYEDNIENQQTPKVVPTPTIKPVSATPSSTTPKPVTPTQAAQEIISEEDTPKNLIDELQRNIQEYKNKKIENDYEPEPYLDNGIERRKVITPELEDNEENVEENVQPKESSPVSNIKRLMQTPTTSQGNEYETNVEETINELKKVKKQGVGNLKESYIDKSTQELEQKPHKLTRSSQSSMPKPKEVIRGKKELISEDLEHNFSDEAITKSKKDNYDEEFIYKDESSKEENQEMSDWLVFLISFIIFLLVFGIIAEIIYLVYFQSTFGSPGELISNFLK